MKKTTLLLISMALATVVFSPPAVAQDEFKPITVFLIRHAEREDEPRQDPPLTKAGIDRSQALARLLSDAGIKTILSSQFTRTKQTAEPLATKLGITVTPISLKLNPSNPRQIAEESTAEVTNKILQSGGGSVLVVGHSNSIPDVIKMLGGDVVPTIDEKKFDNLFIVTVYAKGKAKVVPLKYGSE
ncbi:MAG TPA: phosphoglycerate mutase family protein [Pyrinomonadaceae bacterium]|nr:phosphoglycerate mutase family protein [Pyrinomonadaceae bacterium]